MLRSSVLAGLIASVLVFAPPATPKQTVFEPDLTKLVEGKNCKLVERTPILFKDGKINGVRLNEKEHSGLLRFNGFDFDNGTIEFDVRGQNVPQHSFVGLAFHGLDDDTYEAIYFRPFNFLSKDAVKKSHAVQYVCHPDYPWQRLRTEQPGKFEKPLESPPDPDKWFHVRVVVDAKNVSVFVNDAKTAVLSVERLTTRKSGWLGFFVGDGSGGDFANLKAVVADESHDLRQSPAVPTGR